MSPSSVVPTLSFRMPNDQLWLYQSYANQDVNGQRTWSPNSNRRTPRTPIPSTSFASYLVAKKPTLCYYSKINTSLDFFLSNSLRFFICCYSCCWCSYIRCPSTYDEDEHHRILGQVLDVVLVNGTGLLICHFIYEYTSTSAGVEFMMTNVLLITAHTRDIIIIYGSVSKGRLDWTHIRREKDRTEQEPDRPVVLLGANVPSWTGVSIYLLISPASHFNLGPTRNVWPLTRDDQSAREWSWLYLHESWGSSNWRFCLPPAEKVNQLISNSSRVVKFPIAFSSSFLASFPVIRFYLSLLSIFFPFLYPWPDENPEPMI